MMIRTRILLTLQVNDQFLVFGFSNSQIKKLESVFGSETIKDEIFLDAVKTFYATETYQGFSFEISTELEQKIPRKLHEVLTMNNEWDRNLGMLSFASEIYILTDIDVIALSGILRSVDYKKGLVQENLVQENIVYHFNDRKSFASVNFARGIRGENYKFSLAIDDFICSKSFEQLIAKNVVRKLNNQDHFKALNINTETLFDQENLACLIPKKVLEKC